MRWNATIGGKVGNHTGVSALPSSCCVHPGPVRGCFRCNSALRGYVSTGDDRRLLLGLTRLPRLPAPLYTHSHGRRRNDQCPQSQAQSEGEEDSRLQEHEHYCERRNDERPSSGGY